MSPLREIATRRRGGDPFRALVEQAAIGIEQVSLDGRVLDVNPVFAAMLGYEREELHGRPLADITHSDHIAESTDLHRRLIAGTIPNYTVEKRYLHKDGHPIWVKVTASLAREAGGSPAYRIAVVEDIDHRKLAEARRQADEAKYRAIVDTAVDAIAVIDERGIVQSFNRSAENLFGYVAGEVVGQNVRMLMPEPDRGAAAPGRQRSSGSAARYKGSGRTAPCSLSNYRSPNGEPMASGISLASCAT